MPTLLIWQGYKFRFYALDVDEPAHIHIVKDSRSMKIWLHNLEVAHNRGYNDRETNKLLAIVAERRDEWIGTWNDFFGL